MFATLDPFIRIRRVIPLVLLIFACAISLPAQTVEQVHSVGRFYAEHDGFNGTVTVVRDGHVIANDAYGFANFEWSIPLTSDTRMFIGSATKQFTAAAILLLQEQGKLKTSDPISKFYKDAPATWSSITLRHLLTHTSGIPDDIAMPGFPELEHGVHRPEDFARSVAGKPLRFLPGSSSAYTNIEYILLGMVIEAASGEPYPHYLQRNIFDPLAMKDTGYITNSAVIARKAYGYSPAHDGVKLATENPYIVWNLFAAGALYSTGADLARWLIALHTGKLLRPSSYKEMITPARDEYAYGLNVSKQYGRTDIGHLGDVPGFHTATEYFPDSKTAIIVICNVRATLGTSNSTPGMFSIDNELMAFATNPQAIVRSMQTEVSIESKILNSYLGEYKLAGQPATVQVKLLNGRLTIVSPQNPDSLITLHAESPTRFYIVELPGEVEFTVDHGTTSMLIFRYTNETASQWSRP